MSNRTHPSPWALWPTIAATWIAFSHDVSFQGLALWVVGSSLLTTLVVLPLALAHRRTLAVLSCIVMTLLLPFLAELLGGESAGPITRAAIMTAGVTGAMALVLASRYPQFIVPLSLILLCGALGLGAADQVLWLAGVWTVAAALTLAMLGPYRQQHLRDRSRWRPFATMLMAVGFISLLTLMATAPFLDTPWTIPGTSVSAQPPETFEAESNFTEVDAAEAPNVAKETQVEEESENQAIRWLVWLLLILLLMLLLAIFLALLHRLFIAAQWLLLKIRLNRGPPEDQIFGAWTWVRLRRARYDQPIPMWVSPDIAVSWAVTQGSPQLAQIAQTATEVFFNPSRHASRSDSALAWKAALSAGKAPSGTIRRKWRWLARGPRASKLYCEFATD